MKKIILYCLSGMILFSQTACFGSFSLTSSVYNWNDSAASNKFVKSLLMVGMMIIPIYEIAAIVDILILNLIEFWDGSNPVSMNEDEMEQQIVQLKGEEYLITATKNQFKIEKMNNNAYEVVAYLQYDEVDKTWAYAKDGEVVDIVTINDDATFTYHTASGDVNLAASAVLGTSEEFASK